MGFNGMHLSGEFSNPSKQIQNQQIQYFHGPVDITQGLKQQSILSSKRVQQ
jgi:hypothetical protein